MTTRNELILGDYLNGATVAAIADRYGLSRGRVYAIVRRTAIRRGLAVRRRVPVEDPCVAVWASRHAHGRATLREAADALGCCRQTAAKLLAPYLDALGHPRRRHPPRETDLAVPGNIYEQVYHAYVRGSAKDVAKRFGLRPSTVPKYAARWARHAGLPGRKSLRQAAEAQALREGQEPDPL